MMMPFRGKSGNNNETDGRSSDILIGTRVRRTGHAITSSPDLVIKSLDLLLGMKGRLPVIPGVRHK